MTIVRAKAAAAIVLTATVLTSLLIFKWFGHPRDVTGGSYRSPFLPGANTEHSPRESTEDGAASDTKGLSAITKFINGSSTRIRPERVPPPANSTDIYFSLLTAPVYHDQRFSLQYLTWLQTVDPKQVNVITDNEDNKWIQAFKKEGGLVYIPTCPLSTKKTRSMMCCKTGAQFDHWYRTKESGQQYKWYCHFDDDLYVNIQALVDKLSTYDPETDRYLGEWGPIVKLHKPLKRMPAKPLAPKLLDYQERKRNDFRYANGPAYCISAALMAKVENYFRGKKYEDNCVKSGAVMDDILTGVIIDGVLGIDLNVTDEFRSQWADTVSGSSTEMKKMAQKTLSIGFGRVTILNGARFSSQQDPEGVLSYHCLLHPEVSWCKK